MTRPKTPRVDYDRTGTHWADPIEFPEAERAELAAICPAPGFAESLADIAGEYAAAKAHQKRTPTPGVIRDRARSIAQQAESLRRTLDEADWFTRGRIEATGPFPDFGAIARELMPLEIAARRALGEFEKTRFASGAEAYAAWRLRHVFHRFGLPFTGYDFQADHATPGGPAAVCLRIVFGTGRRTRVAHWIEKALSLPLAVNDKPPEV
jgi:hypothetical protein